MRKLAAWVVAVAITFGLAGCSKTPATAPEQQAAPVPKLIPLQPPLSLAIDCVSTCQTAYESKAGRLVPADAELPKQFADLLADKEIRGKLAIAVAALPANLHERLTEQEDKKPSGSLSYIFAKGNGRAYVYRMVGFGQFASDGFADADVAVDIATHDVAILMRPTKDLDEYYLAGREELQGVLLFEASVNDVWMGLDDLQRAYDRNFRTDFDALKFQLPFSGDMAKSVINRLTYLNTKYQNSQLLGVARPDEELEAKRIKEANAWYVADVNFANCFASMSPADRIKDLRESGHSVRTKERNSGGQLAEVEISYDTGYGGERYYRYFKAKADCEASLPRSQAVPDRYR